ncbi:GGDEF domain-containing protein [Neptunicella sp. SCSIO 80796]|uniref:GGDEF domain-containing protein n=1 Tax=Neptunicella plasticusilytica TaxID=3117012 RepID=UPI003A4DC3C3
MDLLDRSLAGIFIYAILLPAVFWPFDFYSLQPQLSLYFAGGMLFISLLRLLHRTFSRRLYDFSVTLWMSIFAALSLSHAAILSTIFTLAIYDPRFNAIIHVTLLVMGGIASGALMALSPRINLALANLAVLMVPSILAGVLVEGKLPYASMLLIYSGYLVVLGIRTHREYIRSFNIEAQLDAQKRALEQLNKIDSLTHIYNRGYFNTNYEQHWHNSVRNNLELSLLMIDVDHFKSINDTYGHLYGDACLIHIATIIDSAVKRQTDLVARFGGEEFAVLLSSTGIHEAANIAERIRAEVESHPFSLDNKTLNVTVSIGLASTLPTVGVNPNSLIEAADKALYQAKSSGRNCIRTD